MIWSRNLLMEIFIRLHPFTLETCRLVCKQWRDLISSPETAKYFIVTRYGLTQMSTYRDYYFPLPGGEKYRSLQECLTEALRNKDRLAVEYFDDCKQRYGFASYRALSYSQDLMTLFSYPDKRITRKEIEFVRNHVIYDKDFYYIHDYGRLVGYYGQLDFYCEELLKIPIVRQELFTLGVFTGLCLEGSPDLDAFLSRDEIKAAMRQANSLRLEFRCYYPQLETLPLNIDIRQTFDAWFQLLSPQDLLAKIMKFDGDVFGPECRTVCQVAINNTTGLYPHLLHLERYLLTTYPDFCQEITTPRGLLLQKNLYNNTRHYSPIIHQAYQYIILTGDWEIYTTFVNAFYPTRRVYNLDLEKFILICKRPRQRLLYKPLYQLIKDGNLARIIDLLQHLDLLHAPRRDLLYRHCLYAAIRYGKKDLVDYFLYLVINSNNNRKIRVKEIYPLSCPSRDPEIKDYIKCLNRRFQGKVN